MSDQSEETGEEFVQHFGILGMKWGVRRDPSTGVRPIAKALNEGPAGRAAQRNVDRHTSRQEKKWIKKVIKPGAFYNAVSKANDGFDRDIGAINSKPEYSGKDFNVDSPTRRTYFKEVERMYQGHLDAEAAKFPPSPSGRYKFTLRAPDYHQALTAPPGTQTGLPDLVIVETQAHAKHADISDLGWVLDWKYDKRGHVTGVTMTPAKTLKHREISAQPWSNFTKADYTPEQWHSACLIHIHDGAPTSKDQCKLPVKTPSGVLNKNGIHAAAAALAGARGGVDAPSEQKSKAAAALVRYYRELGDEPPDSLLKHSANEAYLDHYGIKGMKWGVRREREDISDISTEDLKKTVERMRLEKQYRDITKDPRTEVGKKQVARLGNMFFAAAASLAINYAVQNSVGKLLEQRKNRNQLRLFKVK